jgi:uncharacterized protein (TIGR02118 family)
VKHSEETMFKVTFLYPWPDDPEAFRNHYVEKHLPLCRAIPNSGRATYAFEPQGPNGKSEWFCIFELECESREQFEASLKTPEAMASQVDAHSLPVQPTIIFYEPEQV